jgi:hypothetical protein
MEDLLSRLSLALGAKEQFQSIGKALDQAELEVCFVFLHTIEHILKLSVIFSGVQPSLNGRDHFYNLQNPDLFDTPEWPHAAQILAHIYSNNL